MRKRKEKNWGFSTIICIILLVLMLPILIVNGIILIDGWIHPDKIPSCGGYKPFIVLSGSMEPTIMTGDLAISKEVDDKTTLKVGDIISFKNKEGIVITHRIVNITTEDGELAFETRGDNNYENDQELVKASTIEGKFIQNIHGLGNVAMFIQKPTGFVITSILPVLVILIAQIYSSKEYKKELEELRELKKTQEKENN